MKRIILAAAIATLAAVGAAGVPGVAGAKEAGTSASLSARHYSYWHHRHHRGWWNHYAGCRVVVRSHINRWGERVFVRRRICY
jgi:hypothetical protein